MLPKLLSNRYLLIEKLGSGAFGETFLAEDTQSPSQRRCVVKRLNPTGACDFQLAKERFDREAVVLESLGEKNRQIPRLYAHIVENNEFYLVQELIEGPTLTQKLASQGPLSEAAVRGILVGLLPVLEFIHSQDIIHRDIKPDNIILRTKDTLPVLIDFGVVKEVTQLDAFGNPTSSVLAGTPVFMPLEQAAGHPMYSSDLYALGMTAIQLLTGKRLSEMQDRRKGTLNWRPHATGISLELSEVLNRATERYPQDRYETASEMLTALDQPRFQLDQRRVEPVVIPPPPVIVTPNPENPILGGMRKLFEGFSRKSGPPPPPPKRVEPQPRVQLPSEFKNSLGIEFVLIPAGEFQMGSTQFGDEKPVHKVKICQPFYLGKYQVTQAQWQAVMGSNPSYFKGEDLPVENVSWDKVQRFIKALNGRGDGPYQLPTEAQWEYACRAGTTGDYAGNLDEMCWYEGNSESKTHPVGQKKPNGWGLYDMHGNVWEWCQDWYDNGYSAKSAGSDPKGPSDGSARVYRGGSWFYTAIYCRSANRARNTPGTRNNDLGFRLVRTAR
ncbi:MAG: SUMF1/EgtB/PvdO family nonheme iron enzyme [Acidobacteria bacterium]|nr:SUMF1/EgtB/PvdO family nonheme iron enzyme [Acidobacteriota bacterium]